MIYMKTFTFWFWHYRSVIIAVLLSQCYYRSDVGLPCGVYRIVVLS